MTLSFVADVEVYDGSLGTDPVANGGGQLHGMAARGDLLVPTWLVLRNPGTSQLCAVRASGGGLAAGAPLTTGYGGIGSGTGPTYCDIPNFYSAFVSADLVIVPFHNETGSSLSAPGALKSFRVATDLSVTQLASIDAFTSVDTAVKSSSMKVLPTSADGTFVLYYETVPSTTALPWARVCQVDLVTGAITLGAAVSLPQPWDIVTVVAPDVYFHSGQNASTFAQEVQLTSRSGATLSHGAAVAASALTMSTPNMALSLASTNVVWAPVSGGASKWVIDTATLSITGTPAGTDWTAPSRTYYWNGSVAGALLGTPDGGLVALWMGDDPAVDSNYDLYAEVGVPPSVIETDLASAAYYFNQNVAYGMTARAVLTDSYAVAIETSPTGGVTPTVAEPYGRIRVALLSGAPQPNLAATVGASRVRFRRTR